MVFMTVHAVRSLTGRIELPAAIAKDLAARRADPAAAG